MNTLEKYQSKRFNFTATTDGHQLNDDVIFMGYDKEKQVEFDAYCLVENYTPELFKEFVFKASNFPNFRQTIMDKNTEFTSGGVMFLGDLLDSYVYKGEKDLLKQISLLAENFKLNNNFLDSNTSMTGQYFNDWITYKLNDFLTLIKEKSNKLTNINYQQINSFLYLSALTYFNINKEDKDFLLSINIRQENLDHYESLKATFYPTESHQQKLDDLMTKLVNLKEAFELVTTFKEGTKSYNKGIEMANSIDINFLKVK